MKNLLSFSPSLSVWLAMVLGLAASTFLACAPAPTPRVAIYEGSPTEAKGRALAAGDDVGPSVLPILREPTLGPALLSPRAELPIARACTDARNTKGFYGFYRTDAWEPKRVALTFDDGPHEKLTPGVLDALREHDQKATFFLVGRNINRSTYPLVVRMVGEGHVLGSHSYTHNVEMTRVFAPDASVAEIVGQHAVTALLIDLALVATSPDDFDQKFVEVFERDPSVWLTGSIISREWRTYAERHAKLLERLGYKGGARPYDVLYARPPGGGPYVEEHGAAGIAIYDRAMVELGMVNVLWNSASGDTVPEKRRDFAFLTENMSKGVKRGGVILIHDYMRPDALNHSLSAIAADDTARVVSLEEGLLRKYACGQTDLLAALQPAREPEGTRPVRVAW